MLSPFFITLLVSSFEIIRGNASRATKGGHSATITLEMNQVLERRTVINERLARNTWSKKKRRWFPEKARVAQKHREWREFNLLICLERRQAFTKDFQLFTQFPKKTPYCSLLTYETQIRCSLERKRLEHQINNRRTWVEFYGRKCKEERK